MLQSEFAVKSLPENPEPRRALRLILSCWFYSFRGYSEGQGHKSAFKAPLISGMPFPVLEHYLVSPAFFGVLFLNPFGVLQGCVRSHNRCVASRVDTFDLVI
jgi:hypothetical protein